MNLYCGVISCREVVERRRGRDGKAMETEGMAGGRQVRCKGGGDGGSERETAMVQ